MRIASVLTPLDHTNLTLAAQLGVTDVAVRYQGPEPGALRAECDRVAGYGLRVSSIEGYLPIEGIKLHLPERDTEIAAVQTLMRDMAECGVEVCVYNFMAGTDWVRTSLDVRERGGALTTAFRLADVERAVSLTDDAVPVTEGHADADEMWRRLERFLDQVLPVAEACGVRLAMHPDDPPLPSFLGRARIMHSVDGFERLLAYSDSPANAVCFCQGTFAEMGVDIPATIRRLGSRIAYVHFRDVRGTADDFVETFHDNGPTDMVAAVRAYRDIGYTGAMRPDHVPQLIGEESGPPGYTMLGRLFAYGYMRGLIQAVSAEPQPSGG